VNAEFNVWLLIVGLVVGAGLAWVVMMDGRRRETEIDAQELPREAAWLSAILAEDGHDVSPETAEQALLLHRAYLGAPPPDPVDEGDRAGEPEIGEPEIGEPPVVVAEPKIGEPPVGAAEQPRPGEGDGEVGPPPTD
jgi:hypothetical protein